MPKLTVRPPTTRPTTAPLLDTLTTQCPQCQALVVAQVATTTEVRWHNPQTEKVETLRVLFWKVLAPPVDPVFGLAHQCALAEARREALARGPAAALVPTWSAWEGQDALVWVDPLTGEVWTPDEEVAHV
jgi:hypothetical protein